jgi:serine/threonine protein kinase
MRGELLADRYRLMDVLGNGGMGTVWEAWDGILERGVAVKFLADAGTESARRLEDEARAAARVTDPRIAALYDVSRSTDGRSFMVMELVRGSSLAELLRDHGALSCDFVAEIGGQVARALAVAHDRGVVHHDIKPANLLVTADGQMKIIDFGIATVGAPMVADLEGPDAIVLGTAAYAAPELALGQPAGAAADLYGLGCVLYQALAGSPPFRGDSVESLLYQHVHVPPPPLRPEVPDHLQGVVRGMLAKDPADRPDAYQVAEELNSSATQLPVPPSDAAPSSDGSDGVTEDLSVPTRANPVKRGRALHAVGLALAVIAVPTAITVATTSVLGGDEDPSTALLPVTTPSSGPSRTPTALPATPVGTAAKPTVTLSAEPAGDTSPRTVTITPRPAAPRTTGSLNQFAAQTSGMAPDLAHETQKDLARINQKLTAGQPDEAAELSRELRKRLIKAQSKEEWAGNADLLRRLSEIAEEHGTKG